MALGSISLNISSTELVLSVGTKRADDNIFNASSIIPSPVLSREITLRDYFRVVLSNASLSLTAIARAVISE